MMSQAMIVDITYLPNADVDDDVSLLTYPVKRLSDNIIHPEFKRQCMSWVFKQTRISAQERKKRKCELDSQYKAEKESLRLAHCTSVHQAENDCYRKRYWEISKLKADSRKSHKVHMQSMRRSGADRRSIDIAESKYEAMVREKVKAIYAAYAPEEAVFEKAKIELATQMDEAKQRYLKAVEALYRM